MSLSDALSLGLDKQTFVVCFRWWTRVPGIMVICLSWRNAFIDHDFKMYLEERRVCVVRVVKGSHNRCRSI